MYDDLKIGDRVLIVEEYDGLRSVVGTEGTVCVVKSRFIGVNHDIDSNRMHNCDGNCPQQHGWYYDRESGALKKIVVFEIDNIDDLV